MAGTDWKSFPEQLAILKNRGLSVSDDGHALHYLEKIGYYCLNGYWYPFRKPKAEPEGFAFREKEFSPGSTFEDAVALYVFDRKLRLLAIEALERIERTIRVDVAHLLGKRDSFAQYEPSLFDGCFSKNAIRKGRNSGKTLHQVWLEKQEKLISRNPNRHLVDHNKEKHGRLPIWVAIEVWDFGALSYIFAGMNINDRDEVAAAYGLATGRELKQWLQSLNFIRNVAAHHSRLWNVNVLDTAAVPRFDQNWRALNNTRPFMYFCIMQFLLARISPNSSWKDRFKDHLAAFPTPANQAISAADFGAIEGWQSWPVWT